MLSGILNFGITSALNAVKGDSMEFRGRLVVVTGGSRGIGAATAQILARKGAIVLVVARGQAGLDDVVASIRDAAGVAFSFKVDLADGIAVAALAETIRERYGVPDVIINIAGSGAFRFTHETTIGEAESMMSVPYFAAYNLTRAFLPDMLRRNSGHIVCMTSAVAYRAIPGATAYSAACWAIRGFTQALRADLYGTSIGVTLVASGTSTTPGYEHYPGVTERMPAITRLIPLVTPEVVGAAIVHGIERNHKLVVVPWAIRAVMTLDLFMPSLVEWLIARSGWTHLKHS
jgi:short-subunit dehydrogenase